MKYCIYCGEKLRDESRFCYHCGKPCSGSPDDFEEFPGEEAENSDDFEELSEDEAENPDDFEELSGEEAENPSDPEENFGGETDTSDEPEDFPEGEAETPDDFEEEAEEDPVTEAEQETEFEPGDGDDDDDELPEGDLFPEETLPGDDEFRDVLIKRAASYDADEDASYYEHERRRRSPAGMIVGIVILAALMAYIWWSPGRKAFTCAVTGAVDEAGLIYNTEAFDKPSELLLLRLICPYGIDYSFNSYNKGRIHYEDAQARIKTLGEIGGAAGTADRKLNQLETLYDSKVAYLTAESMREKGDARAALLAYRSVVREDVNYKAASELAAAMEEEYVSSILSQAGNPETDEEYLNAIHILEAAAPDLPDRQEIRDELMKVRQEYASRLRQNALETGASYVEDGYYKEAIDLINEALVFNKQDTELISLRNTAVQKYEEFVTEQVGIYLSNKDLTGAAALLEKASLDLPDSKAIAKLYEKVRES